MTITGGSLFSGIGGFELAAEIAGLDVAWAWQVERDRFCRSVLRPRFPAVDRSVADVRDARTLPVVDLICGGFPCQGISSAGSRRGLADHRSGLWWEFFRVVRDLRPRFVVVENSPRLLARKTFDVVAGSLASCGYRLEWDCIEARAVGAPHARDRLWLLATLADADGERLRFEPEWLEPGSAERRDAEPLDARQAGAVADGDVGRRPTFGESTGEQGPQRRDVDGRRLSRPSDRREPSWYRGDGWDPASAVRRMDDGLSAGLDRHARRRRGRRDEARLRALGNAVVPQVAAFAMGRVRQLAEAS